MSRSGFCGSLQFPLPGKFFADGAWRDVGVWDGSTWYNVGGDLYRPSMAAGYYVPAVGPGTPWPIGFTKEQFSEIFWRWRKFKVTLDVPFSLSVAGFSTPASGHWDGLTWTPTSAASVGSSSISRTAGDLLSDDLRFGTKIELVSEETVELEDVHLPYVGKLRQQYFEKLAGTGSLPDLPLESNDVDAQTDANARTDVGLTAFLNPGGLFFSFYGKVYLVNGLIYPEMNLFVRLDFDASAEGVWKEEGASSPDIVVQTKTSEVIKDLRWELESNGIENFPDGTGEPDYTDEKKLSLVVKSPRFEESVDLPCQGNVVSNEESPASLPVFTAEEDWKLTLEAEKYFTYGGIYDEDTGEPV